MGDTGSGPEPRAFAPLPADLTAVIGLTALTGLSVVHPALADTPLRFVLAPVFLLFLPGYVSVSVLFPERPGPDQPGDGPAEPAGARPDGSRAIDGIGFHARGIDGFDRVALSVGLSIVTVAVVGFLLNFTPWGVRSRPVLAAVGGFVLVGTAVATLRRRQLPPAERFRVRYRGWFRAGRTGLLDPETRADAVLNVAVILSLVLAASTVGYTVAVPRPGEPYTAFSLATQNETGHLVAADYPAEVVAGEPRPVVVGVANRERRALNYSIVVQLQNASVRDNETTVHDRSELDRLEWRVPANETRRETYDIVAPSAGTRLRVQFLLYRGSPPADPRAASAYRTTHLWLNVSDAA